MIYDILGFPSHLMDTIDSLVDSNETSITFSSQSSNGNHTEKHVPLSTKSESCGMNTQKERRGEFSGQKKPQSELVNDDTNNLTSFSCRKNSDECIGICKCDLHDFSSNEPLKRFKLQSDKDKIFEVIIILVFQEFPKFIILF